MVEEMDGTFESAMGLVYPNIGPLHPPAISAARAVELSVQYVKAAIGGSRTTELMLDPIGSRRTTDALVLVWRVKFHGVPEPDYVEVDAMTGRVAVVQSNTIWE